MKPFELPPLLSGTAEEQLDQLREYLMRLALNNGEEQTPAPVVNTQPEKPSSHGSSFGKAQLAKIYPVGSIYLSTVATNPATLFGFGEWTQIKDRFLLAAGSTYAAGATGGEATHKLTVNEIPSHMHNLRDNGNTSHVFSNKTLQTSGGYYSIAIKQYESGYSGDDVSTRRFITTETGGGAAHNNMPPYLAVYMWKRTA